jgi:hypothetical protein
MIHGSHPQECQGFECAYYQMDKVSLDLRPDNCHAFFERLSNKIFLGSQDLDYEMTNVVKGQIQSFNKQGYSVVMKTGDLKPVLYLAPEHLFAEIDYEYKILFEQCQLQNM